MRPDRSGERRGWMTAFHIHPRRVGFKFEAFRMINEYDWWSRAISGARVAINADAPQSGFYKMRQGRDGPWQPVMIRMHDGSLRCRVGSDSDADPYEVWTFCAGNPVTKEAASYAFKHGKWETDAPTIGDNSQALSLVDQMNEYVAGALTWLKGRTIKSKAEADQAANRRAEILRLKSACEKEWDTKAEPHDKVLKDLKSEYDAPVKNAHAANVALRTAMDDFARAEQRRLDDEARSKHEAERKAAEEARRAVEEQRAKQLADDPVAALTSPEPELPMLPVAQPPPKVQLGGQVGKVTGLRSYYEAEITDHGKALAHYANHPDVVALVQKLAKADSKASKGTASIPGVRCFEDRRVA